MADSTVPPFVSEQLKRLGLGEALATLPEQARFLDVLLDANRHFNLTAIRERDAAWRGHVVDGLTALPFLEPLPRGASLVDVGSGGGVPGIPLAIARPDLRVALLEATAKKARFLQTCLETLGLSRCRVIHNRAESVGHDPAHRQRYDAAVCRAIGPMRELLEYALPLVRVGGRVLAFKGPRAEAELKTADRAMDVLGAGELQVFNAYEESFGRDTVVVVIQKERPTPDRYPRQPGTPKRDPL